MKTLQDKQKTLQAILDGANLRYNVNDYDLTQPEPMDEQTAKADGLEILNLAREIINQNDTNYNPSITEYTKGDLYAICEICDIINDNQTLVDNIKTIGDLTFGDFYTKESIKNILSKINTMSNTAIAENQTMHDYTEQDQIMLCATTIL